MSKKRHLISERLTVSFAFSLLLLSLFCLHHYPSALNPNGNDTNHIPPPPPSHETSPPPLSPHFEGAGNTPASTATAVRHHHPPPPPRPAACDVSRGEWVRDDPDGPPRYTNATCRTIQEHQNCIKYGRPDAEFLQWRWRPDACELPLFEPEAFLEMVRGKSMAFVGDSLSRNQMQSLMCLLSTVVHPRDVSETSDDNFKRMSYDSFNFTVSSFWSPFLVHAEEGRLDGFNWTGLWNVHLDRPDRRWIHAVGSFDYVVISGGNWFTRPSLYFEGGSLVGSNYRLSDNVTSLTMYYGHRKAFRTALGAINRLEGFEGVTILRTVSPAHFEGGAVGYRRRLQEDQALRQERDALGLHGRQAV